jgi:regulator of replication initiation timing
LAFVARFRIKKKQKVVNLERSLSDLQRRADDLEREATELRRENTWLKEMVLMKGRRRVGKRRALEELEETPAADSSNRGKARVTREWPWLSKRRKKKKII